MVTPNSLHVLPSHLPDAPRVLALGSEPDAFRRVVAMLRGSDYDVRVMGAPTDGTAIHHDPRPDLIVLNYEWSPETRSQQVFAWLGIRQDVSPVPVVVCCAGLGFAREPVGVLASRGIEILMHPIDQVALMGVMARRLADPAPGATLPWPDPPGAALGGDRGDA